MQADNATPFTDSLHGADRLRDPAGSATFGEVLVNECVNRCAASRDAESDGCSAAGESAAPLLSSIVRSSPARPARPRRRAGRRLIETPANAASTISAEQVGRRGLVFVELR